MEILIFFIGFSLEPGQSVDFKVWKRVESRSTEKIMLVDFLLQSVDPKVYFWGQLFQVW